MKPTAQADAEAANQATTGLEVPGVGMRGGLGRTLLTAFLVMAIVPLSIVSWYATNRGRSNIQREVTDKLVSVAALKESQVSRWVEERVADLVSLALADQLESALSAADGEPDLVRSRLGDLALQWGAADLALLDPDGWVEWASEAEWEGDVLPLDGIPEAGDVAPTVTFQHPWLLQLSMQIHQRLHYMLRFHPPLLEK